jgi:hypothetical protein
VALAAAWAGIVALSLSGGHARPRRSPLSLTTLARRDAQTFLSRYVADDGRVVRQDQGGDTVSEGQG